jgi:uncharacterized membrane protein
MDQVISISFRPVRMVRLYPDRARTYSVTMRSPMAITLVLLGGGVVTTAVVLPKCEDNVAQGACVGSGSSGTSSHIYSGGGYTTSSASSVTRGGFGAAGASMPVAS